MTRWDCETIFTLFDALRSVIHSRDARQWLITPQPDLGPRAPCEMIVTPQGYERVVAAVRELVAEVAEEEEDSP